MVFKNLPYSDPLSFFCVGKSSFFHSAFQGDQVKVHVDRRAVVLKQNTHAYMYLPCLAVALPFLPITLFLNPKTKINCIRYLLCVNLNSELIQSDQVGKKTIAQISNNYEH